MSLSRGALIAAALAVAVAGCDADSGGAVGDAAAAASPDAAAGEGGEGAEGEGAERPDDEEAPLVREGCTDGDYAEELPAADADISADKQSYSGHAPAGFIDAVLTKRYPTGAYIVTEALENGAFDDCVTKFLSDSSTADAVIGGLSTVVHECGHSLDIGIGGFGAAAYVVTPDLTFECQGGSVADFGGKTFARSLIKEDELTHLLPPCDSPYESDGGCDSYAAIYLNGDPTDDSFDSGDQGFDTLLEETLQYVSSLATGYAFHDHYAYSKSERDGILTFLWYLSRYLRMARESYPEAYALLSEDPCWRDAILTIWGRAWLYLAATDGMQELGINDETLLALATDPELVGEIERLREAEGCL